MATLPAQSKVQIGKKIGALSFETTQGSHALKDFLGQTIVLYFYPKDDTSGCTQEGLDFKRLHQSFKKLNTVILGVSPDSLSSHEKFKKKHGFPFDLIADEEKTLCMHFGVWVEKSMYGRKYMGVERATFVIDAKGVLKAEWRKVKVTGHVDAVLNLIKSIG